MEETKKGPSGYKQGVIRYPIPAICTPIGCVQEDGRQSISSRLEEGAYQLQVAWAAQNEDSRPRAEKTNWCLVKSSQRQCESSGHVVGTWYFAALTP